MPQIPTHPIPLERGPIVESIDYPNPYDYTEKHRHSYFEILCFEHGGGRQLIDFVEHDVKHFSAYIVFPKQIHLLRRSDESRGKLIQFSSVDLDRDTFSVLEQLRWAWQGIIFEANESHYELMNTYIAVMEQSGQSQSASRHLLMALIHRLAEENTKALDANTGTHLQAFLTLLEYAFCKEHSVGFYTKSLGLSEKKLASLTKQHLGLTPLKSIHERLLLEAKRFLVFAEHSHKEISYQLGFDNPSAFSAFVKSKTGLSPSELQHELAEIHK